MTTIERQRARDSFPHGSASAAPDAPRNSRRDAALNPRRSGTSQRPRRRGIWRHHPPPVAVKSCLQGRPPRRRQRLLPPPLLRAMLLLLLRPAMLLLLLLPAMLLLLPLPAMVPAMLPAMLLVIPRLPAVATVAAATKAVLCPRSAPSASRSRWASTASHTASAPPRVRSVRHATTLTSLHRVRTTQVCMVMRPCNHCCSCQNCSQRLVGAPCPICRTAVASTERIFF